MELHPPPRYPDIKPIKKNMMCRQPIRPNNRNIQNGMETTPMVGVKQELDNCQKQIQRTKENLEKINEQSGKLLSLFLCNGESEREVRLQTEIRAMENTEAPPLFSGEQPQVPQANLMQSTYQLIKIQQSLSFNLLLLPHPKEGIHQHPCPAWSLYQLKKKEILILK